jgi:tRNA dimethylallyltransferase
MGEKFDVGRYVARALEFIREQEAAGRRVLAVGGTGLYFRALTRGLCEAPRGSEALRAELAALPVAALRERLRRADPEMLARVDAANPRRLARALEVIETTGRSLRAWQEETTAPAVTAFTAFWLQREPAELDARMEKRIGTMFAAGWVEEVRGLVARYGLEKVKAFPAIGYRQIAEALAGKASAEAARRDILVATRQYARRQLTWFRREPRLRPVMLSHSPPLPAALRVLF